MGITGTPVIDIRDPGNVTAYFITKSYQSGTSGPAVAWMHAVDIPTLAERSGFPVQIQGTADNQTGVNFDATYELQRPGLLMLGDTVYAAFAGHCDIGNYQGWVVGVNTAGNIRARWSAAAQFPGAGIWQSGGGPMADGPDTFIVATGNGDVVHDADARASLRPTCSPRPGSDFKSRATGSCRPPTSSLPTTPTR